MGFLAFVGHQGFLSSEAGCGRVALPARKGKSGGVATGDLTSAVIELDVCPDEQPTPTERGPDECRA